MNVLFTTVLFLLQDYNYKLLKQFLDYHHKLFYIIHFSYGVSQSPFGFLQIKCHQLSTKQGLSYKQ